MAVFLLTTMMCPPFVFSGTRNPINRTVLGMPLGLTEKEFLKTYDAVLVSEDPDFDQRVYSLKHTPEEDVNAVFVNFFRSRLLKLDIEFDDHFVRTVQWFDLLKRFNERYGVSRITQLESGLQVTDLADWNDGQTHLILRHVWKPDVDTASIQSNYRVSYIDSDYYVQSLQMQSSLASLPSGSAVSPIASAVRQK